MITSLEPLLRQLPFFDGKDDAFVQLISRCAKNVRFSTNAVVARHGEPADEFFLIREGRIALEMPAPQGGAILLQTADEGDVVGFSWLVPPYHWHYDLRAMTDLRAFSIDGRCLRQRCEDDPGFGYQMMKRFSRLMAEQLETLRLQLLDLYPGPAKPADG